MRLIDKTPKVSRRTVLRTTAAAAAIAPAAAVTGTRAFAAMPSAVSAHAFATLVKMARDIYPHDKVGDRHYAKVIEGLDAAAKDDAAAKTMLEDGVAALDAKASGMKYADYIAIPEENERAAILKEMEASPFFQKVRGSLVTGLYNNQEVWPIFGYEGESAGKGGYIDRGFGDIDWLDKV